MKVSKLSELSREVTLYSTYIIRNQTYEDFSIEYEQRNYVLERYFWLFVTDSDIKRKKHKGKISFFRNSGNVCHLNFENSTQVVKLEHVN